jgi:hypothetical protein
VCHQRRCFVAKHDGEVGAEPMREVVTRGGRGSNERGLGRAPEVRVEATMLYWFRKCVTSDGAPMRNTTTRSGGAHERGGEEGGYNRAIRWLPRRQAQLGNVKIVERMEGAWRLGAVLHR